MRRFRVVAAAAVAVALAAGCSGNKKLIAHQETEITRLQGEVDRLRGEVEEQRGRSTELETNLKKALVDLEETEVVCLQAQEGCQRIGISEGASFPSGGARLTARGKEIIDRVWGVLDEYPDRRIIIEGHTDDVPIAPKFRNRFRSNWDLSVARALSVLHYILESKGVDPSRMSVVGYGEHQPQESNATEEGRAKNRRVVIAVRDWLDEY